MSKHVHDDSSVDSAPNCTPNLCVQAEFATNLGAFQYAVYELDVLVQDAVGDAVKPWGPAGPNASAIDADP